MKKSDLRKIYCKSDDVVAREIEGELIIIPIVSGVGDMENEIYALDEIGQEIWNRIDGHRSINQIIDELESVFDASRETIQKDVLGLINEIVKRKIIIARNDE